MEQTVQQERRIHVIPATKQAAAPGRASGRRQRVAAYCRVSTDSEEQLTSYTAQKAYYTQKIGENPDWEMAGIFADKGITGTSMKKRTEFKRMIAACKRGRIDLILTKSLSRFARNTVDSLEMVRMLRANGIGVIFEKENINTLTESSEFLITLFSGFAQAESESISKNVIWGIQKSREAGNVPFQYQKLLGYRRGPDGQPEIIPEEAETVKRIFRRYLDGCKDTYIPSADTVRLTNAINRGLEHPDKPEDIVSLILQGASARYDCCPAPTESETFNRPAEVDLKRFGQAVSHITIADGTITVHFK